MAHPHTPESGNENPGHHVPLKDASIQTTARDFFILLNTRDANTQTPDGGISFLEQFRATGETPEESRKRNISNVQEITHCKNVGKLPRTETCEMGDQFVLSSIETSCINPDFENLISTPSHTEFESSRLVSINPEFQNFDKSHSQNQELNLPVYSGNTENINSQQNIEYICIYSVDDIYIDKDIYICSVDDTLSIPDPSVYTENNSQSKSCEEKVQNGSPLKQQPSVETEPKQPTCLACNETISAHVEVHEGKDMYKCCRCLFKKDNFNYIQMHIYNVHFKQLYCDVCEVRHSQNGSHGRGGTCDVCDQNFECKFQLEEHYILVHKDFLETHCRICKRKLEEHLAVGKGFKYQCCVRECKVKINRAFNLNRHLGTHSLLKLFKCEVCGCHFKLPRDHKQNVHPSCKSCDKRFVNIFFLNEHHCEEHREE